MMTSGNGTTMKVGRGGVQAHLITLILVGAFECGQGISSSIDLCDE